MASVHSGGRLLGPDQLRRSIVSCRKRLRLYAQRPTVVSVLIKLWFSLSLSFSLPLSRPYDGSFKTLFNPTLNKHGSQYYTDYRGSGRCVSKVGFLSASSTY